jgi:S1-C subfamily serine protease
MNSLRILLIPYIILLCFLAAFTVKAQEETITNQEVISLTKAGLSKTILINKIRASKSNFDLSIEALIKLKDAGVEEEVVSAMMEVKTPSVNNDLKPKRLKDELSSMFPTLKNSVVTVWSEYGGHGSGFIINTDGLIVTNFHVVGPSKFASVQFDENRKVEAIVLASSSERDVAVLWANIEPFTEAIPARLVDPNSNYPVEEGERVIAIGSPLNQKKAMTTGIVSKLEERAIISDVNINHGNSGGPLFNSVAEVIGINTFGDFSRRGGPGLAGIVRIEQALPVIEEAKKQMASVKKPSSRLLLVEPKNEFPISAIKEVATAKKFDFDPYIFEVGKFTVTLITPSLKYRLATENEREALKGRKGREEKSEIKGTFNPFQELYGWAEYLGEYKPVLHIRAMPEIGETAGSMWTRALVGGLTGVVPRGGNFKFKADFYKMKLFCGEKEVEPIQPSKIAHLVNEKGYFINLKDATYEGIYTYPADAINEQCGAVRIEIFSGEKPNTPQIERLKAKYIQRLALDFKPYFEMKNQVP